MMRLSEVVKNLLIINVVLFFGTLLILGEPDNQVASFLINNPNGENFSDWKKLILALFMPGSEYFQPYQLVTHMFMHADLGHLFFNMFGLFMFGPPLENRMGGKKFLSFYLIAGFGAMLLHFLVKWAEMNYMGSSALSANIPVLGASGAIFGLLAGFGTLYPNTQIMLLFPPIPMKAKYFVMIYAGIELFLGLGKFGTGVAHFAHLGGALFGFLLIRYWQNKGELGRS
ncbi:MAG: rhomboid family intramembrane serine protease [Saprospiraceae bacterium]|nr:rhomboid family intramembrane serine protease [Saprospiraceae bacterium]